MRNTNRVTRAARAVALVGSTLLALALLASPGYAGPDHTDEGHHPGQSITTHTRHLQAILAHRAQGQRSQAPSNSSDHLECTTVVIGGNFDSVTVPEGAGCVLQNATVDGNVTLEEDALLTAFDNTIGGNVAGDGYREVLVQGSSVRGNVRLQDGGPSFTNLCRNRINGNVSVQRNNSQTLIGFFAVPDPTFCPGNIIGGNLSVTDNINNLATFNVVANFVGGDAQINDNRGIGPKTVQNNLINRTLSCFGNQNPFIGTPNNADRARGQCAP